MANDQLPTIKGFIENSLLDWPGQICAVLFLPYCNLRCPYCHNHQLVLEPDTLETLSLEAILDRLHGFKEWVDGICITGGEPTIHRELPVLLRRIHEAGFKTKLDTNGTQPETLHYLISEKLVNCVAMDVKAPLDDSIYAKCAGVYVPVSIIRESINVLMAGTVPYVLRCTVTPSILAGSDVYCLAEQLKDLRSEHPLNLTTGPPLSLQNFNPADPLDPELKNVQPYTDQALGLMQKEVNRILS